MTKKLTKIVESDSPFKARELNLSPLESQKRINNILEKQKAIKNITYTRYELDKASSPYSRPYNH